MKKEVLKRLIFCFIIFSILASLNLFVFATNANIEINSPEKVNFGESFDVSLKVPANTYGLEATVTLKYSNGTQESQRLVYIEGLANTKNLLTFKANVAGNAELTFSNIILCDKDSNVIETDKTKTKYIKIEKSLTGLSLNYQKASIDLINQKILQLNSILTPSDSTDLENVIWTSNNENIATVDKNGLVTAKKTGKATITASCKGYNAICEITVVSPITKFSLNKESMNLYYNKQTDKKSIGILEPIIEPYNTTDSKEVLWSTSNNSIVTVENGIVTPTGIGTTTIVAKCGGFTAFCKVTVIDEIVDTILDVKNVDGKLIICSTPKMKAEKFLIEENFPILLLNSAKIFDSKGNEKSGSNIVGTKDVIKILDSQNNVLTEYTIIVPGDINGDGQVKMYDAFSILKGTLFGGSLNKIDTLIRDYNNDGQVKMYDAFSFLKYSLFN